jgi:hypothetical protein
MEASFGGKLYIVGFSGMVHFMSRTDRVALHIPHGIGPMVVGTKSLIQNRGSTERGREARAIWLRVLEGDLKPESLPLLDET